MELSISELKQEHFEILMKINNLKNMDFENENPGERLHELKEVLLDHLEKEDSRLYPGLRIHAENDHILEAVLRAFPVDLLSIKESAEQFFNEYEGKSAGEIDAGTFKEKLAVLYDKLKLRIEREEAMIFAEYEKIYKR